MSHPLPTFVGVSFPDDPTEDPPRPMDIICGALDSLGVRYLREAPVVDTAVVEMKEGFATFQFYERLGFVTRVHSLYQTDQIPEEVLSDFADRWMTPDPPDGVLILSEELGGLSTVFITSSLNTDASPDEALEDVGHRLYTAIRYSNELADLAKVSTWEVEDTTIQAIIDYRAS